MRREIKKRKKRKEIRKKKRKGKDIKNQDHFPLLLQVQERKKGVRKTLMMKLSKNI